ncbi:redoxin domain-containing protein [Rhizobium leguminosarum]|nr:redoxin domain-containing protein [Rhizobium leguminosarum]NKK57304.1 redoxin domain-containing protein [Rhizobium leguminosarum bv. viciae]
MAVPGIGVSAPDFNLPRDGGGRVSLAEFHGRPLVLFFYPKDDTTGCTAESLAFTALASEFEAAGAAVIGMSPDSAACHDKFIKKHGLSVALASDEEKTTLQAYGVWKEKSMYGRNFMGVERTTFLIRQDGTIATIWQKVKVQGHAETVLEAVRNLAA